MRTKLVVGNWKMNGSLVTNKHLLGSVGAVSAELAGVECAVCVPYPYLAQAEAELAATPALWGAQDVCQWEAGSYTGEVSVQMLLEFGCRLVIVGHSERRVLLGESDSVVAEKFIAARKAGLCPILCVGETLEERQTGKTRQVVLRQLDAVMQPAGAPALKGAVIAYEPVWAIGTGHTATPDQAQEVHALLRGHLASADASLAKNLRILYGGSVKAANARELFSLEDVDGGLVGGASLAAEEFAAICRAAV